MRKDGLLKRSPPFQFSRNWFLNRNLPTFRSYVKPEFVDKPCVYLELGVFEGQSMVWMCQHVLTHTASRGVGVDPWLMTTKLDATFMEAAMASAFFNTAHFGYNKCQLIRGSSAEVLRKMHLHGYAGISDNTVDLCMIDGNHNALAVLDDVNIAFPLVKPGGWLLFDDVENDKPKTDHVRSGIDMFLDSPLSKSVELIWKDRYMECYRKK